MPREVIGFALRQKGTPEHLVDGVMSLYKGCKTFALGDRELSSSFSVKVRVHQGFAFSPILFYHGPGCFDRWERWLINGIAVCRQLCFV